MLQRFRRNWASLIEDDEAVVKFNELMNSSSTLFDNSDDDDERVGTDESNCLNLDNQALQKRAALLHLSDQLPFVIGILGFL